MLVERQEQNVSGLLNGTISGALFGIIVGVVSGITVLAFKHPKVYKKLYGVLLVILLGALAGGAISDLSNGAGYSRFIVTAVILYVSFLRAIPLLSGEDKPVKEEDDK
ncbi:MAG: hypothetical protein CR217_15620 [Beijerinckiaceae bacterium]|nr:MAG: hypothetical protein CR217_15620 [Beijerinckiaceae bacterium]